MLRFSELAENKLLVQYKQMLLPTDDALLEHIAQSSPQLTLKREVARGSLLPTRLYCTQGTKQKGTKEN
jgi:hypothetical protein